MYTLTDLFVRGLGLGLMALFLLESCCFFVYLAWSALRLMKRMHMRGIHVYH
jgi:hypothetical protein